MTLIPLCKPNWIEESTSGFVAEYPLDLSAEIAVSVDAEPDQFPGDKGLVGVYSKPAAGKVDHFDRKFAPVGVDQDRRKRRSNAMLAT